MSQASAMLRLNGRRLRPRLGGHFAAKIAAPEPKSLAAPARDGLRASVVERCEALGVRLTAKRRRLAEVFDMVPAPIDLETVWWKTVELELEINRSSLHRLANDLVTVGVLREIGVSDRRTRYATPPAVAVEVIVGGVAPVATEHDPTLIEHLLDALARHGVDAAGRRIVISLAD